MARKMKQPKISELPDREFLRMMRERRAYTTGQIARMLQVAPRTVSKWCDSGRLQHFRIPGSEDRRIPRSALERFVQEGGMEEMIAISGRPMIMVLSPDPAVGSLLESCLTGWDIRLCRDGFSAGTTLCGVVPPDVVLLDMSAGRGECAAVVEALKSQGLKTPAIALDTEDGSGGDYTARGYAASLCAPADPAVLVAAIFKHYGGEQNEVA